MPRLTNNDFVANKEDTKEKISSFSHRCLTHVNPDYDNCRQNPCVQCGQSRKEVPLWLNAQSRAFPLG